MSRSTRRRAFFAAGIGAGIAGVLLLAGGSAFPRLFGAPVPDQYLPELVLVPAGEMALDGSRRVAFERPFLIGKFEVTFAQWDYCHRAGGCTHRPKDRGWGRGGRPVIDVSWDDAAEYLEWLSDATGERYRLPSEEEWEYAARAGAGAPAGKPPLFTDPRLAWASTYALVPRRTKRTKPVGSGEGNRFGVFGTRDNVWEWTGSCRVQSYDSGGRAVSRKNCGVRILQGEHRSPMPSFVRDIGSGGCSVKPMPGNFGFRVVRES
ncbi:MAG: SUMF1/EgtB/PvdO family nonheme iron enzyme [Defluviicoccus sp.]|nr:SUMF1/EgtB/PvdO family nonheme iron enzyme [Defluviicoccus sp.]